MHTDRILFRKVDAARALGVCSRTISRWMATPEMNFPQAIRLHKYLYFDVNEIAAWKAAHAVRYFEGNRGPKLVAPAE